MSEDRLRECECPERLVDMVCYGIHICRDGQRVAPESFYSESEDDSAQKGDEE